VASSLTFDRTGSVSVFETTIRELGGLLAAFDCSGDPVLATRGALADGRYESRVSLASFDLCRALTKQCDGPQAVH
jgi:hypothetical protein